MKVVLFDIDGTILWTDGAGRRAVHQALEDVFGHAVPEGLEFDGKTDPQIAELIAVVLASLVMYYPLYVLHVGDIKTGGVGFGGVKLPAPQAGLMAALAQGIVGGEMPWPLVATGALGAGGGAAHAA